MDYITSVKYGICLTHLYNHFDFLNGLNLNEKKKSYMASIQKNKLLIV